MAKNTDLSYRQVMVGRAMAGLVGLDEAMEALAVEGVPAQGSAAGNHLVEAIRAHNYVPASVEDAYAEALRQEYEKYLAANDEDGPPRVWRDPRREGTPWFPTILDQKCDGCGKCIPVCPNQVLGWNPEKTLALVLEPLECMPNCSLCASVCRPRAIIMPPRTLLHERV